ncbi:OmpH family outer membrane protein [Candidatus Pelagibacter sp.]|nr:OmpH family outer membrane protein [Candidatus Pelagibacter sp.]
MKLTFLVVYFILISLSSNFVYAEDKIVFVDSSRIINTSLAGQSITEQLKILNKKNIENFTKKENDLKKEETKLLAQKNVLDEEQYINKVNNFKSKVEQYNNDKKKATADFNKKKYEAQKTLLTILQKTLSEYSEKNSIALIISKENVIIGKKQLDITELVIEDLNSSIKEIQIK